MQKNLFSKNFTKLIPVGGLLLSLTACGDCVSDGDKFLPSAELSPKLQDLGPVVTGNSCTALVLLENNGGSELTIESSKLTDKKGDWNLKAAPQVVAFGGKEEIEINYTAGSNHNTIESASLQLVSNLPEDKKTVTARFKAVPVEAPAGISRAYCPGKPTDANNDLRCTADTIVNFGAILKSDISIPVEQRTGRIIELRIKNEGTAVLNINKVYLKNQHEDFLLQNIKQGNIGKELPLALKASRLKECEAPSIVEGSEATISVTYAPGNLGKDNEVLVIESDASEGAVLEINLTGFGADVGLNFDPAAAIFTENHTSEKNPVEITVLNLGPREAAVNNSCIDLDGDGSCDANCTASKDDTALEGTLRCAVKKGADNTHEGKGFILAKNDGQEGGDDQRLIQVFFSPTDTIKSIPENALLRFESAIQNNKTFTIPLVTGGVGELTMLQGSSECSKMACIPITGDSEELYAGQIQIQLLNSGTKKLTLHNIELSLQASSLDDYSFKISNPDSIGDSDYIIGEDLSRVLEVNTYLDLTINYANNDQNTDDFGKLIINNSGLNSPLEIPLRLSLPQN